VKRTHPETTHKICILLSPALLALSLCAGAQTLLTTVPAGSYPVAIAVNSATNIIYVVNQNSNSLTVIDGATDHAATVGTGAGPVAVAINPLSNKIYVANQDGNSVTEIDGATNHSSSIAVGNYPIALAANPVTNKIYVANYGSNNVTVIDGATNRTTTVNAGARPLAVAVNSATNKIYVANNGGGDVTVIDGVTNSTATIGVGAYPRAVAINQATNTIYVLDSGSNQVSIIDGATNNVSSVAVGTSPSGIALDPVRNRIYVTNTGDNSATIIDGTTLATTTVAVGTSPDAIDVDPLTDKAYLSNSVFTGGSVTMINGADDSTATVFVRPYPTAIAVNSVTNRVYVANSGDNSVSVIAGATADPLQFVPLTPCRVADTRLPHGPFGGPYIAGQQSRSFPLPQSSCGIPPGAAAYSLNVTAVPVGGGALGYLTIWPTGESQPVASTLNSLDGRTKANAAIVPAGVSGAVSIYASNPTDVVLDINGYFQAPSAQTLQFYPLPPCRVLDTRGPNGDLGGPHLPANRERDFPFLESNCQIPAGALAYSMNFTVVPVGGQPLGYLSVWPAGHDQPVVSTLNNPTATDVANAAIVPAGTGGSVAVYVTQDTQLVADINGYFAPPGLAGLSLYSAFPFRVLDTRTTGGAFTGKRNPPVDVAGSPCGIPQAAQAYVFNATVVPRAPLGYLTLWPDGGSLPVVSTLNALDGAVTSNMAVVPNTDGKTAAYAAGLTDLIVDISSYFAP